MGIATSREVTAQITLVNGPAILTAVSATGTAIVIHDSEGNLKWTQASNTNSTQINISVDKLQIDSGTGSVAYITSV